MGVTYDDSDLAVASGWPIAMFVGLVTVVIGVIVLVWPSQTLVVLSILFGINLLLFGLFRLISAFSSAAVSPGLTGFVGIIGMIAGVVVLRHPFETVAVLATVLGVVWIVGGAIEVIGALADRSMPDRWLVGLAGVFTVVMGIAVLAWPKPTLTVIAWIAGIYFILFGISLAIGAWRLRSLEA